MAKMTKKQNDHIEKLEKKLSDVSDLLGKMHHKSDNYGVAKLMYESLIKGNETAFQELIISEKAKTKRFDYRNNHDKVLAAMHHLTIEKETIPTKKDICEVTGLSRNTVNRHLEEIEEEMSIFQPRWVQIGRQRIVQKLYRMVEYGRSDRETLKAMDLFMRYTSSTSNDIKKQTNYIQVNNLKITEDQLSDLPHKDLQEIQLIISKKAK